MPSMRNRVTSLLVLLFVFLTLVSSAQNGKGGLDAVAISKNYYNSIVKILLYDSTAAKINPDLAYLGRGSGFFVSDDGYIFTNRHVIDYCRGYCRYTTYNAEEKKEESNIDVYSPSLLLDPSLIKITYTGKAAIIVQLYTNSNGSSYNLYYAKVVVIDTANFDGAILKIVSDIKGNPVNEKFHPVPFGNSDSTEQGQDLCLYGFPAQLNGNFTLMLNDLSTLMFGKHSGFDYNINKQYGFIKTDATINSGNSGGPVFGPSNNVIGIATATFSKTNLGLVGGINDMYDLVRLIPDLASKLSKNGLISPQHKPDISTAMYFKPFFMPSANALKKINDVQVGNKVSKSIGISLGIMGEIPHGETHTIDPYVGTTPGGSLSTTTNGGHSYKIPTSGYGLSAEFSSPSVFKNQEKNMLTAFYRISYEEKTMNWNAPNLYTAPLWKTTFQMNSSIKNNMVDMYLGISYSRVLGSGAILGLYYAVGLSTGGINEINIGTASSYGQTVPITYDARNVIFPQMVGFKLRYKAWFADVAYSFYTVKADYTLPYDYYQGLFYSDYFVTGQVKANPIYLTIGYTVFFYPKKH